MDDAQAQPDQQQQHGEGRLHSKSPGRYQDYLSQLGFGGSLGPQFVGTDTKHLLHRYAQGRISLSLLVLRSQQAGVWACQQGLGAALSVVVHPQRP